MPVHAFPRSQALSIARTALNAALAASALMIFAASAAARSSADLSEPGSAAFRRAAARSAAVRLGCGRAHGAQPRPTIRSQLMGWSEKCGQGICRGDVSRECVSERACG